MADSGYLYIIKNKAWPDWVKIGITENLDRRLRNYQTSSPLRDYELMYSIYHPNYRRAEKNIRDTLKPFATDIKNEWFRVDLTMAKDRLEEQLEEYKNILT